MNKTILDSQTLKLAVNLSSIKSKNHFLRKMQDFFEFPEYFGDNIDALDDCMRDLSWLPQENIIIEFYHLNRINNKALRNFITDCLICYQNYWQNCQDKKVAIVFN